nr:copia protein [Tanacetum cinerariifolium]
MAQPTARNHAHRGYHMQYAQMTLQHPQMHIVPTAVLTKSKPVPITAVRPVSTDVPKLSVTRLKHAKPIVNKTNSPPRRHINRSPSPKASNSPPRVTAVKALVVNVVKGMQGKWEWKPKCPLLDHGNPQHALKDKEVIDSGCSRHMTGNMSYLSDFEELNGGYVAFGGDPKGGKISRKDSLGKFDGKVDEGFLVGYSISSKSFRVFNSRTRIVQETLHVNFLENKPNVAGSGPTWLFDIDTLTKTMNYQPVTADNQSNHSAVWSSGFINPQNTDGDTAFDEKEPKFDAKKPESKVNVSPSSSAQSKKHDDKTKREAKGKSLDESFTRYRNLSAEFEDFSDNSINEVNDADASQHPDDPDMPELEDITYSDDEDDVGAEADFNNLETSITKVWNLVNLPQGKRAIGTKWVFRNKKDERGIVVKNKARIIAQGHIQEKGINYKEVFAPVARIEAIRLFLAYASFMGFMVYQMDVNSAFLYGTIEEEVYVCQPLGFEDPDHLDKVYKVVKKKDGIFISQDKYVAKILRKFRLTDRKSASTSIDTKKPLLKDPDGEDVDVHTYRSMIGSLMYLTSSRPDINDYAGASLDRKSTTGGCQFLGCRLISWQWKKQSVVATSSIEGEYVVLSSMESLKRMVHVINTLRAGYLTTQQMVLNSPCLTHIKNWLVQIKRSLFWTFVAVKKVNDVTRLQALVDKKKVVITEATIRDALRLDDAEGVEYLPNKEIFVELARMGFEKSSTKLTFYKAFFSSQWKFLIHTILQCMSAKRTS